VLQQEGEHGTAEQQCAPVGDDAGDETAEGKRRGIGFKHAFDVPFAIQLGQARADLLGVAGVVPQPSPHVELDAGVDGGRGVLRNPVDGFA